MTADVVTTVPVVTAATVATMARHLNSVTPRPPSAPPTDLLHPLKTTVNTRRVDRTVRSETDVHRQLFER